MVRRVDPRAGEHDAREGERGDCAGTAISCPRCNAVFPLSAAIEQTIVERMRAELAAEIGQREQALQREARQLQATEAALRRQQQELETRVQEQVRQGLAAEVARVREAEAGRARDEVRVELEDLTRQLAEQKQALATAQQAELELRRQRRELEQQRSQLDLEMARRLDAARAEWTQQAHVQQGELLRRKDDEFRLREAEKEKQLADLKRQIDELRRRAEQGSQQAQGEVLELDLEAALRAAFPEDAVQRVPKGTHGGDVLHQVRSPAGGDCGTIVWESKRTKAFSDGWLAKLKDDALAARAQLAVLVTTAMPKDLPAFGCRDGVWVVPPPLAVSLALALRQGLLDTAAARRALEGRQDKMAELYDYLSGPHFQGRVTAIVEAFTVMRHDLEQEKRAMLRVWAKREKQIERVVTNTVGMHGDLAGIIGRALPAIDALELPAGDGDDDPAA